MRDPCCGAFAQNGVFSHIRIALDFLSLPDTPTRRATSAKGIIMKTNHSNRNSNEFRPIGYLALLVWPAITALMFILAGNGKDQPSNLAQGQPSVSVTAPTVASYASVGETPAP